MLNGPILSATMPAQWATITAVSALWYTVTVMNALQTKPTHYANTAVCVSVAIVATATFTRFWEPFF